MPLARKDMIGLSLFGGPALPGLAPARRDCPEGEVRRLDGGVMSEIIPQVRVRVRGTGRGTGRGSWLGVG